MSLLAKHAGVITFIIQYTFSSPAPAVSWHKSNYVEVSTEGTRHLTNSVQKKTQKKQTLVPSDEACHLLVHLRPRGATEVWCSGTYNSRVRHAPKGVDLPK